MSKITNAQQTAAAAPNAHSTNNPWEEALRNPNLSTAEKVEIFAALRREQQAAKTNAAPGEYVPRASILKTDDDRAAAMKIAPAVFAELVNEWRLVGATQDWNSGKLLTFAMVDGARVDIFGKKIKARFEFLAYAARRVAEGELGLSEIDYSGQLGKGGKFYEWLGLLASAYTKTYGEASFLAQPQLVKATKA